MEIIESVEFFSLHTENVIVIEKRSDCILALADVEYWEECPKDFSNDPYRINVFKTDLLGNEWILDQQLVSESGVFSALIDKCNKQCGSIYFAHEKDRLPLNAYEELFEMYYRHNPTIIVMSNDESCEISELADGIFILCIDDELASRINKQF